MLQDGCYWRPAAVTSANTQPLPSDRPDSSLAPDDLDLISSDGQPSLLPSPDSTHSIQNSHDQPVSGSSQAEEGGSPTQASEPAAPSAGTVTSSVGEEGTPVHEISSCDSPKPDRGGVEDREEEAATDDSVVEQQDEQEVTSVWEVNDSSSECFQAQCEPGEASCSQSATSPPSASPCSQADEQQDAPPAEGTGPADVTACSSGLSRHRTNIEDNNKMAEGDCPSSCPPAERAEAGTPGTQVLKGMRRRWQQASLARTGEPSGRGEPSETDASQHTSTEMGKGTLQTAATKHSAVKSKAVKPLAVLQCIAESIENTPEHGTEVASQQGMLCGHTGLVSLAETPVPMGIKEDPHSPDEEPRQEDADKQVSPIEIALGEEGDHAGLAEADLTVQSEQRAMQELYRFQKHSMLHVQTKDGKTASVQTQPTVTTAVHAAQDAQEVQAAELGQPVAPPVALYANLPTEWPPARISVYARRIGVLLRVTLNRRLAELSFRGVEFLHLPREVIKHIREDFDAICGAMAAQLAALFAFLQPSEEKPQKTDQAELALYADPTYWLYGLLSFCAKSCEAKTAEAGGEPDFRTIKERKQDSSAPALEPTRNSLALMQTVVMSFARGLYLGKPELPIDHVHVYFPVQIAHKVIAQCEALKLKEGPLAADERYRHNVDNAANNPYVIVGVFEGRCSREQYPSIPTIPILAMAYEEGMLDASLGQIVSFASFYQTSFRVEVPLWRKLKDGIAAPALDDQTAPRRSPARETPVDKGPSPRSSGNATKSPGARTDRAEENTDEETTEEESYVPATGQGCFSFEMSLLQRAAQTFAKRSVADHYMQVARWLHTGLATATSRKSWHLLSKHRAYTITPLALLRVQFKIGYLSTEKSDRKKPYAATDAQGQTERDWEWHVNQVMPAGYLARTHRFHIQREAGTEIDYFRLIDRTVELPNIEGTLREAAVHTKPQTSASSSQ